MSWNPGWNGALVSGGAPDDTVIRRRYSPDVMKAPDEVVRLKFPWAARLDGDTLSAVSYETPDGMETSGDAGSGSERTVLVGGGESGRFYRVIATAVTTQGRTLEWTKRVLVMEG